MNAIAGQLRKLPYLGRWFRILGATLLIGALLFPHPIEATDLSSCIAQADPSGMGDAAAQINACVAALHPSGGTCDACCLKGAQTAHNPILLVDTRLPNNPQMPIILLLDPSLVLTCTTIAPGAACLQYGNNVQIIGAYGGAKDGSVATIKTDDPKVTLLAAADQTTTTAFLLVSNVDFWNASAATVPVVDLTNTNHGRFDNVFVQHSGGTGSLVQVSRKDDIGAEYNTMVNVKLHGGGSGIGYNLSDNANDFKVIGGNIQATDTAIQIEATSTTMAVNGVTFQDVSVEGYTGAALRVPQYAYGIRWFGGRLESNTGTLLDIGSTGVKQIYIYSPDIVGSQGYGVDPNGVVNWIGYTGGPPGPTVSELTGRIATRVGTALNAGALILNGWGTAAFADVTPGSRDQRGQLTIHTGSAPQKNASITLTFRDGTWTTPGAGPTPTPPFCLAQIQSVSPSMAKVVPLTETTTDTELVIGMNGAPSANATYTIGWLCLG